jgi:hypothetical protein
MANKGQEHGPTALLAKKSNTTVLAAASGEALVKLH